MDVGIEWKKRERERMTEGEDVERERETKKNNTKHTTGVFSSSSTLTDLYSIINFVLAVVEEEEGRKKKR